MPVRIYDIAKKLGIESKEVLVKAKELGITAARVPSSSLDKITAEYLESHFKPAVPVPPPVSSAPAEPMSVITEAPPEQARDDARAAEPVLEAPHIEIRGEVAPVTEEPAAPEPAPIEAPQPIETRGLPEPSPAPPAAPPEPPQPRVGDLIGRIQLPPKPGPKPGDKIGSVKLPQRPVSPPARQDPQRPQMQQRFGQRPMMGQQGRGPGQQQRPGAPATPAKPEEPKIVLPADAQVISIKPPIIVRELAEKLNRRPYQLIADLIELKVLANVNQAIDEAVAQRLCAKYGFKFEVEKRERRAAPAPVPVRESTIEIDDKPEDLKPRPPVVTIMGHVDHGKTTLLDVIRKANVAAGEAGGITQHIGAYTIAVPHPERKKELAQITFLDTPGHAAFSAMRSRGANVTDIVVLVVAANDGVMPQTIEALNHAKAAKVPILVAVNKVDHPNANPLKVRQQLQEQGLVSDEWGGDTIFVDVSALTKQGVDKLLEMILFQADLLELKANPTRRAKGNVIESGLSPGGPTATVLVRKGTLKVGDAMICGPFWGRVRALINEEGQRLKEAGPSVAVKVLGLNGVPEAGVGFSVLENEKEAREEAGKRVLEARAQPAELRPKVTLENLFDTLATAQFKVLKAVVKADTQGSVEAIVEALKKIDSDKVSLEIIHNGVGTITESDVHLASASRGLILGFHTRIDVGVSDIAKREGVQIKLYSIIYELIDEVKEAMAGLLEPILKENVLGSAEVRKVFELSKGGKVAGCAVTSGRITRGKARVMRRKSLIYEGAISALKRFQDEVNEVRAGMECGIRLEGFQDFQPGDAIESFSIEKVAAKL
ncbi:MAG TPA: translation initiation factor IF-2 [Verrucomicrobiae bacterium]|nr:translation initiation factor IF-2 [Verrucomicrobiae bacterium]